MNGAGSSGRLALPPGAGHEPDPETLGASREALKQWRSAEPASHRHKKKKKKAKRVRTPSGLELVVKRKPVALTPKQRTRKVRPDGAPLTDGPQDDALAYLEELEGSALGQVWLNDPLVARDASQARPEAPPAEPADGVIAALPRRVLIASGTPSQTNALRSHKVHFEASTAATIRRLFIWLWATLRYFVGTFRDSLRGNNTIDRRAVRLRLIMESLGPTFVKVGQQLSIRADLLPYAYCQELAKMLDKVAPFPTKYAIEAVERVTGKPIGKTFAVFDPTPVGSASLSCVYQAVRHSGERVAVKVRRPGIGPMLAADLQALDWIMQLAETMSFLRDGLTKNLRIELRSMLMEELNFHREARYTELFRRRAKKKKQDFVTAPRVHFDISGPDVIVTEFISGVFLSEIIGALDINDEAAIRAITGRGIDPVQVAKRMVLAFNWETLENLLFHADPHPANIVIKPDNTIVFIDFGSCGRFSSKTRRLWQQLHYYLNKEDVQGMVEASISILEPLPPIDIDRFTKQVEQLYWDWLYAMKDKNSEWWEKASGMMWISFVGITRRYNIPVNLDTLRLFRATFLYDTIMYRLWPDMDMDTEYQAYHTKAAKRAERRVRRAMRRRVEKGLQPDDYMRIEDMGRMFRQITGRLQHVLDTPRHNFTSMLGKAAYGASVALKLAAVGMGIHVFAVIAVSILSNVTDTHISLWETATSIVTSTGYQVVVLMILLVIIRKTLMRVEDIDVDKN